jgi:hypothetical protein
MSINFHHERYKFVGYGLSVLEFVLLKTTVNNYDGISRTSEQQKLLNQRIMQIPVEGTNPGQLITLG